MLRLYEKILQTDVIHLIDFLKENYEPKGQLKGYPFEIIAIMLVYQMESGNGFNLEAFEMDRQCQKSEGGFDWENTLEGRAFWYDVLYYNIDEVRRSCKSFYDRFEEGLEILKRRKERDKENKIKINCNLNKFEIKKIKK